MMTELNQQLLQQVRSRMTGRAGWLNSLRTHGADRFETLGLPDNRAEDWKYTSLKALFRSKPKLAPGPGKADLPPSLPLGGLHVCMLDGRLAGSFHTDANDTREAIGVSELNAAMPDVGEAVKTILESLPMESAGAGFSALNTALLESVLVIRVEAGRDAGRLVLQWASSEVSAGHIGNARVCLLLGEKSRLELVEHYPENSAPAVFNTVLQCELGPGAKLVHNCLQEENAGSTLVTRTRVQKAGESHYRYMGLDIGGGLVRHDLEVLLQGAGSRCHLDGAYVLDGRRHVDNHLAIEHIARDTTSGQFFRGVLSDRGRGVFNGRVHIHAGADGSEVRQSNANMLLSPHAEVDTKPELEIHADEVVASHGATVGELDETALFYLRSRGLGEAEARHMLTNAFCVAALEHSPAGKTRELLIERLRAHLPGAAA
jgi:Fe-S cluster assembly protein SufD